jgi:hypothetical protein
MRVGVESRPGRSSPTPVYIRVGRGNQTPKHRFDFKALGYEGDPAVSGGRFYMYFKRGLPPR